ncbi:MAG TPA: hypothetical protein VFE47_27645 [Tepidisphaeraceae bacterium]|jgi:hypothetical protein|nr:hypothetical protein [Tepidisphaeraceae bacterium]
MNTSDISTAAPKANEAFRRAVYDGQIYLLPATDISRRLIADVLQLIEAELGQEGPVREAQFRLTGDELFRRIGRLRKVLYEETRFLQAMRDIVGEYGFDARRNAFDPLRLRVSTHRGFDNPKAAPIYYAHRDTWYSHPACQISWWIPLHDLPPEQTFVFFPDFLRQAVENNSGDFDYDTWTRDKKSLRIGWQDPNAGTTSLYPGFHGTMGDARRVPFSCRAGEILVFAGAHLHQTVKNETGMTRFSVDFRTADVEDFRAGIGAPNVDNRSTGSALRDYFPPLAYPHSS